MMNFSPHNVDDYLAFLCGFLQLFEFLFEFVESANDSGLCDAFIEFLEEVLEISNRYARGPAPAG